jgi:hypothetical protein
MLIVVLYHRRPSLIAGHQQQREARGLMAAAPSTAEIPGGAGTVRIPI